MSGRILPVALATALGVSIGVAAFDREFKEQRRKRLEDEYNREVAAQAALTSQGLKPMAANAISPPSPQDVPAPLEPKMDEGKSSTPTPDSSSWSSLLGLWAWKKDATREATPAAQKTAQEQTEQKSKP